MLVQKVYILNRYNVSVFNFVLHSEFVLHKIQLNLSRSKQFLHPHLMNPIEQSNPLEYHRCQTPIPQCIYFHSRQNVESKVPDEVLGWILCNLWLHGRLDNWSCRLGSIESNRTGRMYADRGQSHKAFDQGNLLKGIENKTVRKYWFRGLHFLFTYIISSH